MATSTNSDVVVNCTTALERDADDQLLLLTVRNTAVDASTPPLSEKAASTIPAESTVRTAESWGGLQPVTLSHTTTTPSPLSSSAVKSLRSQGAVSLRPTTTTTTSDTSRLLNLDNDDEENDDASSFVSTDDDDDDDESLEFDATEGDEDDDNDDEDDDDDDEREKAPKLATPLEYFRAAIHHNAEALQRFDALDADVQLKIAKRLVDSLNASQMPQVITLFERSLKPAHVQKFHELPQVEKSRLIVKFAASLCLDSHTTHPNTLAQVQPSAANGVNSQESNKRGDFVNGSVTRPKKSEKRRVEHSTAATTAKHTQMPQPLNQVRSGQNADNSLRLRESHQQTVARVRQSSSRSKQPTSSSPSQVSTATTKPIVAVDVDVKDHTSSSHRRHKSSSNTRRTKETTTREKDDDDNDAPAVEAKKQSKKHRSRNDSKVAEDKSKRRSRHRDDNDTTAVRRKRISKNVAASDWNDELSQSIMSWSETVPSSMALIMDEAMQNLNAASAKAKANAEAKRRRRASKRTMSSSHAGKKTVATERNGDELPKGARDQAPRRRRRSIHRKHRRSVSSSSSSDSNEDTSYSDSYDSSSLSESTDDYTSSSSSSSKSDDNRSKDTSSESSDSDEVRERASRRRRHRRRHRHHSAKLQKPVNTATADAPIDNNNRKGDNTTTKTSYSKKKSNKTDHVVENGEQDDALYWMSPMETFAPKKDTPKKHRLAQQLHDQIRQVSLTELAHRRQQQPSAQEASSSSHANGATKQPSQQSSTNNASRHSEAHRQKSASKRRR